MKYNNTATNCHDSIPYAEAASPVRLVRPRPDHFSAGRWSHFQTAETVCQRNGWARCPTQARLCPACRRFSYKSFLLSCQQIMQEPGAARPDCIGTHVLLNTHACVYDVQLLAIWRIPLLAVVPLLSLALRVGLMRRLPTMQLLSLPVSEKNTDAVLYHLHISCCRPPYTCTSHLLCAVA